MVCNVVCRVLLLSVLLCTARFSDRFFVMFLSFYTWGMMDVSCSGRGSCFWSSGHFLTLISISTASPHLCLWWWLVSGFWREIDIRLRFLSRGQWRAHTEQWCSKLQKTFICFTFSSCECDARVYISGRTRHRRREPCGNMSLKKS